MLTVKFRHVGITALLVLGISSCTSFNTSMREGIQPNAIPVAMQPMFAACSPSDGEVQLSVDGGNTHVSEITVVWNIPDDRSWEIQFNSPMGDTRLALRRAAGQFSTTGDLPLTISVDQRGFMAFNDHLVPLRDRELPCVLAGRWPVSWLSFLQKADRSSAKLNLAGKDDVREIVLNTSFTEGSHSVNSCAVIQWGGFIGLFKHEAKVCIKRTGGSFEAQIDGPSHYVAKWSQLYDES